MKASFARPIALVIMVFALSGCYGTDDVLSSAYVGGGAELGPTMTIMGESVHADVSSPATEIDLSPVANVYALANAGSAVPGGGLDGYGNAYARNLTGPSIIWNSATFALGTAGTKNAVRQTPVTLPGGSYASLMLLATGVHGNQPGQTFVVNYADGTHTNFVQSLSDWYTPQGYTGESIAFTFPYRLTATGATDARTFYVYGYTLALNSTKTLQSVTLPNNVNIVVVAIDLVPVSAQPKAATPTMSPPPGTYNTAQSVALSDATPGAAIYYTTNGATPTTSSAKYSSPIPVAATTTIKAIAVASGYTNSDVASSTYTITSPLLPVTVSFSTVANVYAVTNAGSAVLGGGIDGHGYAYAGNLTGPSITWNSATFALGTAGTKNGVRQTPVTLPAGSYASLMLLATGVNGNQPNQTFVVNYADGTHTNFVQGLSDWYTPQSYNGESIAFTFPYRLTATGATDARTFHVYGYTLALNSTKTLQSVTLPNNVNIVVVAIDLVPVSTQPKAATPTMSPPPGTYNAAQFVALSDATSGAAIYYTTNGTTPTTVSAKYSSPIPVAATTTIKAIAVATGYSNSDVASTSYTITPPPPPITVSLATPANVYAFANAGSAVLGGGIDGQGHAYARNLTGPSITWNGSTFALGTADSKNGVRQTTVTPPAGNYTSLMLLATGVNGNQPNQTFVVNYADGTHTNFVQGLSDWYTPQSYNGESIAFTFPYRLTATGATEAKPFHVYGYTLALNSTKTLQSITLPSNGNVVVVAIDLIPVATITGVTFYWASHRKSDFAGVAADGSDNWSITWSNNNNQYAIWGDGGGFGGTGTDWRSSLGVARIEGDSYNYKGFDRYGGKAGECSPTTSDGSKYTSHTIDGKSHGAPLSLGGALYAWITPKSAEAGYQTFTLYTSTDKACTWTKLPVSFDVATYGISFGSFVQFGKDNGSAIDAYVYTVATAVSDSSSLALVQRPGSVMLLRVPVPSIEQQSAYEFFTGLDGNGQPLWSSDVHQAVPVYQDSDGVGPFPQVSYVPDLGQFVYTNQHGDGSTNLGFKSLLTMAEAPRPWGPWTDFYRNLFGGGQVDPTLFQWNFAPKWFRDGGRGFTLIFSGPDSNDSWNTVDGAFTISR